MLKIFPGALKHLPHCSGRPRGWTWVNQKDLLEKEMATHPSILVWKIPWMEKPGGLQYMGSQRVGHDWASSCHFYYRYSVQFSSVQSLSRVRLFVTPWTAASRLPCPSPTPRVYSNSCPSHQWCPPTILSSVVPFSFHLQSCPASGSFPMSHFFSSVGQSIRVSASALVFLMNIQYSFPSGLTGLISLQSKGLSRVFSNTIVQKHQFFGAQLSL